MFQPEYEVRAGEWSDIRDHLPFLFESAAGRQVIELGVRSGNSTAAFLAAMEQHGGHLWSVDTAPPSVPEHWFTSDLWTFTQGDDLVVFEDLPDGVDVVFIDTVHTYGHTRAELRMYQYKVKPGGVMLLHDTELRHPEIDPHGPEFPVRKAVEEFAEANDWKLELHDGCYGLAVLHKPAA